MRLCSNERLRLLTDEKTGDGRKESRSDLMKLTALLLIASLSLAQAPEATSGRTRERIVKTIRNEILGLPFYGPFDWITCHVNGTTVTLHGATVQPTIKAGAEEVVAKIEGVEHVVNTIDVLPLGFQDDEIRYYVYNAIMRRPTMTRYAIQGPNSPLHILVKYGRVTLEGFVGREEDKTIATMQAKRVRGVFSVKNNLRVDETMATAKHVRDKP